MTHMKYRGLILFSCFVVAGLALASWWVGHRLPADAQLPLHWNARGEVDHYGSKWTALMLPPLVAAGMTILFWGISRAEPQQDHLASSQGLFRVAWIGMLGIAAAIEIMLFSAILHWGLSPIGLIIGAIGLVFAALGDQLGKTRPMYMVGIRTPWTLADPEVWMATHRLGGKLMGAGRPCLARLRNAGLGQRVHAPDPGAGDDGGEPGAGGLFLLPVAADRAGALRSCPTPAPPDRKILCAPH